MTKELKMVLIIGGVIVAIVAVLIGVAKYQASTRPVASEALVRSDSHSTGGQDAQATLVEFGDFQCPSCAAAEPIVEQLRQEYGDKLKFVYRNYPLTSIHPNAAITARAAEAAALQGKFWEMHDLLFSQQTTWASLSDPTEQLKQYATQLSLDLNKFNADLNSQSIKDKVKADQRDGDALAITGTPTFFLNGKQLDSYAYDSLKSQIDAILSQASSTQATTTATPAQ